MSDMSNNGISLNLTRTEKPSCTRQASWIFSPDLAPLLPPPSRALARQFQGGGGVTAAGFRHKRGFQFAASHALRHLVERYGTELSRETAATRLLVVVMSRQLTSRGHSTEVTAW